MEEGANAEAPANKRAKITDRIMVKDYYKILVKMSRAKEDNVS